MRKGFTLIELLVTIAIIGILATVGLMTYGAALAKSRDTQRASDLQGIKNAIEQFYVDNHSFPAYDPIDNGGLDLVVARVQLEDNLTNCSHSPKKLMLAPNYITTIPEDPAYRLNLAQNCKNTNQYGQYLYLPQKKADTRPLNGYVLIARMERTLDVNYPTDDTTLTKDYKLSGASGGLQTCTKLTLPSPTNNNCSHNYLIDSSRNN